MRKKMNYPTEIWLIIAALILTLFTALYLGYRQNNGKETHRQIGLQPITERSR